VNIAVVERSITLLVQQAPAIDTAVADLLVLELRSTNHSEAAPLALAIARIVELVAEQIVDPGIALPALAMACATLGDGVRGTLGKRELEAARYEIETLLPMPGPPGMKLVVPDVPLTRLTKRS
jgi:hypothetical protein